MPWSGASPGSASTSERQDSRRLHLDERPEDAGPGDRRRVCRLVLSRDHHRLIPRRKRLAASSSPTPSRSGATIQTPRGTRDLLRAARHDDARTERTPVVERVDPQYFRFRESRIRERPAPCLGSCQRVVRPVAVGKTPPAVQHPEGEVLEVPAAYEFESQELATGREQRPAVGQRLPEIPGGVEHVCRNDQVVAVRVETLRRRIRLDIERAILDRRAARREARFRLGKESRRDVGKHVVEAPFRQLRKDRLGRRPGAGADLQHPQAPAFPQSFDGGPDRVGQHPVRGAGGGRGAIEVCRARPVAAEDQRERIRTILQDLGEGAAAPLEESELVRAMRVPGAQLLRQALRLAEACVRQRVPGPDGHGESAIRLALQYPCLRQNSEQPAEQPPVWLPRHPTFAAKGLRLDGRACVLRRQPSRSSAAST